MIRTATDCERRSTELMVFARRNVTSLLWLACAVLAVVKWHGRTHSQVPRHAVIEAEQIRGRVIESYEQARLWLLRNVQPDGLLPYSYDFVNDAHEPLNNEIRQLLASRYLATLAAEDSTVMDLHRRNLSAVLEWYRESPDGHGYILFSGKAKLGAAAMALQTLALSPDFAAHAAKAEALSQTIRYLMDRNGSFTAFFQVPLSHKYDEERLLTFYSGEAILGLIEYGERAGDPESLIAAAKAQEYYIGKYVHEIDTWYYPAYVPWHTITLSRLWHRSRDSRYAMAAFALNDRLLAIQDTVAWVGRFYSAQYPEFGTPHASSDGIYTEGLAYALELATLMGDRKRMLRYRRALQLAVSNLTSLQIGPEHVSDRGIGLRAIGAFRTREGSPFTRIDCTQHIIDAYRRILLIWH